MHLTMTMVLQKRFWWLVILLVPVVQIISTGCSAPEKTSDIIEIKIWDENKQQTAARVRVTNMKGDYLAPIGHSKDFKMTTSGDQESIEKDILLDENRRFAYVDGFFQLEQVDGPVRIEVVKGFRYRIYDDTVSFSLLQDGLDLHLEKAFNNIPEENWYTGDVHVHHINVASALLEIKAEDLNVCNLLISDFTKDHQNFRGTIEPESEPDHLIFYNQEYRENG